jgi:hypothetical protein
MAKIVFKPRQITGRPFISFLAALGMLLFMLLVPALLLNDIQKETQSQNLLTLENIFLFYDYMAGCPVFLGIILIFPHWLQEFVRARLTPRLKNILKEPNVDFGIWLFVEPAVYYTSFILVSPYLLSWLSQNQIHISSSNFLSIFGQADLFLNPIDSPIRISNMWRNLYSAYLLLTTNGNISSIINIIVFIGAFAEGLNVLAKISNLTKNRFLGSNQPTDNNSNSADV